MKRRGVVVIMKLRRAPSPAWSECSAASLKLRRAPSPAWSECSAASLKLRRAPSPAWSECSAFVWDGPTASAYCLRTGPKASRISAYRRSIACFD
eukprot:s4975_g4.t1